MCRRRTGCLWEGKRHTWSPGWTSLPGPSRTPRGQVPGTPGSSASLKLNAQRQDSRSLETTHSSADWQPTRSQLLRARPLAIALKSQQTQGTRQGEAMMHADSSHPSLTVHSSEIPPLKAKEEHLGNIRLPLNPGKRARTCSEFTLANYGKAHLPQTD